MSLTTRLQSQYAPGVPYSARANEDLLHQVLFRSARLYPDRVAFDFMGRTWTYRESVSEVRRAATVLAGAGVRPGDRVAMVMPNCPQHVFAVLATSLLGAIVAEHNPLAPEGELEHEYESHGAKVSVVWINSIEHLHFLRGDHIVFGVDLAAALPHSKQLLLKLPIPIARKQRAQLGGPLPAGARNWEQSVKKAAPWSRPSPASLDDPALLIHTGGTTGTPKAVTLSHNNIGWNLNQDKAWVSILNDGAEVFYAVLPLFHAFGFSVGFMAGLRLGASVVLFPKFDAQQFLEAQERRPCTVLPGVPPIYERVLNAAEQAGADLGSIRFALSGAMPISAELVERWDAATKGYLIEGYGMSEASPLILGSPLSDERRAGTLGLPFPSTEVKIVDPENPAVETPEGEIGELIVRGPQVFLGYWNDPKETALALRDGWLFTGDLVRLDDGFIVMADRRKELILTGGFNVYPSQVEEAVRAMPEIEDVAVVGVPAGTSGEEVVAALVLKAGSTLTLASVREWAEKSLAHYALPRQIVIMQELPKSQVGKVMRKKVREQLTQVQAEVGDRLSSLSAQTSDPGRRDAGAGRTGRLRGRKSASGRDDAK